MGGGGGGGMGIDVETLARYRGINFDSPVYTVILPCLVKSPMVAQGRHGDLMEKHGPAYGELIF